MSDNWMLTAFYQEQARGFSLFAEWAYNDQNESCYTDHESSNQQWRMSNIVNELESRCKLLEAENKHLNETVHKYKTEYEVETAYLKNQVTNERERQMQWKNLYFEVHAELTDLKRQNQKLRTRNNNNDNNNNNNNNNTSTSESNDNNNNNNPLWHTSSRPPHNADSGCQACVNERKRKVSESEITCLPAHSIYPGLNILTPCIQPTSIHPSPKDKLQSEDGRTIALFPSPGGHPPPPLPFQQIISQPLKSPKPTQSKLFDCHDCGMRYNSEQKLHFHMQVHSDDRHRNLPPRPRNPSIGDYPGDYYNCPECNQNFAIEDDYRHHLLVHMFKCRLCGIPMDNEVNFVIHMKTQHNETNPLFYCFLCDKQFSHVQQLTGHLLSHPHDLSFDCTECGKHFTRKAHLTRHMSSHSKCRPYPCKDCGKRFAHKTHLRRHEIVHSGLRPHQCKVCQHSFSRKSSLSRHYFIHTTEKPFVCPVCDKGFNRKGRLKNHLNIHIREGYPHLADYTIERRPITREFIEKINQVKSDESLHDGVNYATMTDMQGGPSFIKREPRELEQGDSSHHTPESLTSYQGKEESDDSSCSDTDDGEIDEVEANMSEEITFDQPPLSSHHPPLSLQPHPREEIVVSEKPLPKSHHSGKEETFDQMPNPDSRKEPPLLLQSSEDARPSFDHQVFQRDDIRIYEPLPTEEMRLYDRLLPRSHPGETSRTFEGPHSREGSNQKETQS